jgi:hypothetical protein
MAPFATLAQNGYRRFGPLPVGHQQLTAHEVTERAGCWERYEVHGEWVRRIGRRKGTTPWSAFEVAHVFDRTTDLGGDRLGFVDDFLRQSCFANHQFDRVEADSPDTLSACVTDARTCEDDGEECTG